MRTLALRSVAATLTILLAAMALIVGSAAYRVGAADHLDAPTVRTDGRIDINDVYVFEGNPTATNTVLAMTVSPAAGMLPNSPTRFRPGAVYAFNVSTNGDAIPEIAYRVKFGGVASDGTQKMTVHRANGAGNPASGAGGKAIGSGSTDQNIGLAGGGMAWAGLRDDPFFFDLEAFIDFKTALLGGSLTGLDSFCDGNTRNFFDGFNGMAIVLEVPDSALGGTIKVWSTVSIVENGALTQVERMGLPTINTVFNHDNATKEAYNRANPANDVADYSDDVSFVARTIQVLLGFSLADATAHGVRVAAALLPDVITYNTATSANFAAPLNGRALADDVIDVALSFTALETTTGLSDCIGNDSTFLPGFPYLGDPT